VNCLGTHDLNAQKSLLAMKLSNSIAAMFCHAFKGSLVIHHSRMTSFFALNGYMQIPSEQNVSTTIFIPVTGGGPYRYVIAISGDFDTNDRR